MDNIDLIQKVNKTFEGFEIFKSTTSIPNIYWLDKEDDLILFVCSYETWQFFTVLKLNFEEGKEKTPETILVNDPKNPSWNYQYKSSHYLNYDQFWLEIKKFLKTDGIKYLPFFRNMERL